MEKNYCVYKHTTPSGKVYIGITGQNPEKRWLNGKGYCENIYFNRAINKYGWDAIKHEIVMDGLSREEACKNETILILKYKANNPLYGYNLTTGGDSGFIYNKESIKRLSKTHKEINKDGRNSKRNVGAKNALAKTVYQYTPTRILIKEYGSVSDAARFLVLSKKANRFNTARHMVMSVANHKKNCNTAYGYIWSYEKYDDCKEKCVVHKRQTQTRSILKYTKTGKFIKKYNSITEAANELGVSQAHIVQCARGDRLSAHGFIWMYEDTENPDGMLKTKVEAKMKGGKMWSGSNHRSRAVNQYDFDLNLIKTFPSIEDASRELGISPSNISGCAGNKKNVTAGGFIWKYVDNLTENFTE